MVYYDEGNERCRKFLSVKCGNVTTKRLAEFDLLKCKPEVIWILLFTPAKLFST